MLRREHFPKSEYHDSDAPNEFLNTNEFSANEEAMFTEEQFDFRDEFNCQSKIGLASREEYEADEEEERLSAGIIPGKEPFASSTASLAGHPMLHTFLSGLAIALTGLILITTGAIGAKEKGTVPTGTASYETVTESGTESTTGPEEQSEAPSETETATQTETETETENETETETETESLHAHSMTFHAAKEANCTEEGFEAYYYCEDCGSYFRDEEGKQEIEGPVSIAALGHDYQSEVMAPDCVNQGHTTHTCSRCGDSYEDSYTAALGHSPGAVTRENMADASCTAAGGYDEVTRCTRCNAELSRNHVSIAALGHDFPIGENAGRDPTRCSRCGTPALTFTYDAAGQSLSYTIHEDFYNALAEGGYTGNFYVESRETGIMSENEYWTPESGRSGRIAIPTGSPGTYQAAVLMIYTNGITRGFEARSEYTEITVSY